MRIGDRFQALMNRRRMTHEEAAARLGVSRQTISYLVNGKQRVTATMALRLKKVFGVDPSEWLFWQAEEDLAKAKQRRTR